MSTCLTPQLFKGRARSLVAGIQSIDKTTLVSLQVFKNGHLVDELPLFRENWEEYGGRQERTGLGEAVWRSEDPFSFHRLVTHDGADKEAAELMMQAHVVVFFLRLMMVIMVVMMMMQARVVVFFLRLMAMVMIMEYFCHCVRFVCNSIQLERADGSSSGC